MTHRSPAVDKTTAQLPQIQAQVQESLDRVVDELRRIIVADFDTIEEVNDYLLKVRGKLFRPTLLLLSNEVAGTPSDQGVTFGAVIELVHLATLVHDDAVDHSVLRRGMPTVNALWTHQIAIIMGDYLYSRSVTELARMGRLDALGVLADAANEMSVGEMRQLLSYDALDFSEEDYYKLIAAKTASLMSASCEMGALAGAPQYRSELKQFGFNLGMAFQIADDMLDYTGTEDETGKPAWLDLRERKVTLPLIGAMREMSDADVERVRHFFTLVDPPAAELRSMVDLVRTNGGLDYARQKAAEYAESAEAVLAGIARGPALDALRESVAYAIDRTR